MRRFQVYFVYLQNKDILTVISLNLPNGIVQSRDCSDSADFADNGVIAFNVHKVFKKF